MTESKTVATGSGTAPSDNVRKAIRAIADAIVESVAEAGSMGAPSGIVYAALNSFGVNLETYQRFISALVNAGRLEQRGNLLFTGKAVR